MYASSWTSLRLQTALRKDPPARPAAVCKDEEAYPLIVQTLASGAQVLLPASGHSMQPTLRQNRDSVILSAPPAVLRRCDLPLYRRDSGKLVLHRVVSVQPDGTYTMCGDHQFEKEAGIRHDQIVGLVTALHRKGRDVPVTSLRYRLWVRFWVRALPLRRFFFRCWAGLCKLRGQRER